MDAGARTGKKNRPIENWHIPKLEFLQSVVRSIRASGALIQWSADVTEHAHIEVVKEPSRAGNNQNYEEQICRTLDRADKARRFEIATSTREAEMEVASRNRSAEGSDDDDDEDEDEDDLPSDSDLRTDLRYLHTTPPHPPTPKRAFGAGRERKDYFQQAKRLLQQRKDSTPFPLRTFSIPSTAFHLTRDPAYKQMSLDDAAAKFSIPDLIPAVSYFLLRLQRNDNSIYAIGGRRPRTANVVPPFNKVEVWTGLRLQSRDYYCPNVVLDSEKLNALPPTREWPVGRYDTALANIDPQCVWPRSGLSGQIPWPENEYNGSLTAIFQGIALCNCDSSFVVSHLPRIQNTLSLTPSSHMWSVSMFCRMQIRCHGAMSILPHKCVSFSEVFVLTAHAWGI
jgi:hypothetical protein